MPEQLELVWILRDCPALGFQWSDLDVANLNETKKDMEMLEGLIRRGVCLLIVPLLFCLICSCPVTLAAEQPVKIGYASRYPEFMRP